MNKAIRAVVILSIMVGGCAGTDPAVIARAVWRGAQCVAAPGGVFGARPGSGGAITIIPPDAGAEDATEGR